MNRPSRVLLVEHLDAIGAASADARVRAAALRELGMPVDVIVLDGRVGEDLLYESVERLPSPGAELFAADEQGRRALAARVRASRASLVVWASAAHGGGSAARLLPGDVEARWWPAGHASNAHERGPLRPLFAAGTPVAGSAIEAERASRPRLSLWDGPFVLAPALLAVSAARRVFEAFAEATREHDEADLVVLEHLDPALESLADAAGIRQRVHFVGPAPRDAEGAWLATASLALLPPEAPVSGGWLLRALGSGCPLLPLAPADSGLTAWLAETSGAWWEGGLELAMEAALERAPRLEDARERGRAFAARHDVPALAARIERTWDRPDLRAA